MSRSQAKRRGAEAEIWPVERAWAEGLEAERLTLSGRDDPGDWWMHSPRGELWVMQSKAVRRLSLTAALRAVAGQAQNFATQRSLKEVPRFGVLVRPYGLGRARIDEWPLVQPFGQLLKRG